MNFYAKTFLKNVIFYQILMLFKFLKISYIPLYKAFGDFKNMQEGV